jgi:hypothetical protein
MTTLVIVMLEKYNILLLRLDIDVNVNFA